MRRLAALVLVFAVACGTDGGGAGSDVGIDPVAHYPFDADAVDAAGGPAGVVTGARPVADRFGADAAALDFDGDGDFVTFRHHDGLDLAQDFTLSVWIDHRTQATADDWYTIFEKSDPERDGHSRYGIWVRDDLLWGCFEAADNATQPCADTDVKLPTDGWHHVAAVRAERRLILYLDGEEVWNAFVGLTPVSQTPFDAFAGTDRYASDELWLDASLDDLRVYDVGLSPEQIATLAADR